MLAPIIIVDHFFQSLLSLIIGSDLPLSNYILSLSNPIHNWFQYRNTDDSQSCITTPHHQQNTNCESHKQRNHFW